MGFREEGLRLSDRAISLRQYYKVRDYVKLKTSSLVIPDSVLPSHCIFFGGTRTGKSRCLMAFVTYATQKGWNVIILDPKMEQTKSALLPCLVEAAIEANRLDELRYMDVMLGPQSVKFNPFGMWVKLQEVVEHVLAGIPQKANSSQFFRDQAKRCVTSSVEAYDYLCRKEGKKPVFTISRLNEICRFQWIEWAAEILASEAQINPGVRDLAARLRNLADLGQRKFEEIHSDLSNVLVTLGTGVVGEIIDTEQGTEIFDALWEDKGLLMYFYTGALLAREGAGMISRVFLSSLTSLVGKVLRFKANGGKLTRPLVLIIDECQNAIFQGSENLLDKAGGAGVRIIFACQTKANLSTVLGRDLTQVYLDNIGVQCFLNCGSAEDSGRYVASKCGTVKSMEVWKRTSDLGEGSTVRDREINVVDPGAVGRLRERQFICFLRRPNEPAEPFIGFVRYVPDPKVTITGLNNLEYV